MRAAIILRAVAALFLGSIVSFSYGPTSSPPFSNPTIDYPRLLIADTNEDKPIFQDEEITAAYNIQLSFFQSSMLYSAQGGQFVPPSPVSYLRVAALLLDSLAANKARIASVIQLLDVRLDPSKASQALRDQAKQYREVDDDSGAFMIIEQVNNLWSFQDRFWKQVQRLSGTGGGV